MRNLITAVEKSHSAHTLGLVVGENSKWQPLHSYKAKVGKAQALKMIITTAKRIFAKSHKFQTFPFLVFLLIATTLTTKFKILNVLLHFSYLLM